MLLQGATMKKTTMAIHHEDKKLFAWMKLKYEEASKKKYSDSEFFHLILGMLITPQKQSGAVL